MLVSVGFHGAVLSALAQMPAPAADDRATVHGSRVVASIEATSSQPQPMPRFEMFRQPLEILREPEATAETTLPRPALEPLEVTPPAAIARPAVTDAVELFALDETASRESISRPQADAQPEPPRKPAARPAASSSAASVAAPPQVIGLDETTPPTPLRNPAPVYPSGALRRAIQGQVMLRLTISAAGDVTALEVATSSGSKLLDDSALRAVGQWRFHPAQRGGEPIEWTTLLPVEFRLRR